MHTEELEVINEATIITRSGGKYRCIGTAYGWNEEPQYDAAGRLINKLTPTEEAKANAQLWAAAPDLLEALEAVLEISMESEHGRDRASRLYEIGTYARAAIAKATGHE